MRNLVENAVVHGTGGTVIEVSCGNVKRAVTTLSVVDDGPGVPGSDVRRLVKRFARGAGAAGRGTGLGLSIVDSLARRMGAELVLASPATGQRGGFEARVVWLTGKQ